MSTGGDPRNFYNMMVTKARGMRGLAGEARLADLTGKQQDFTKWQMEQAKSKAGREQEAAAGVGDSMQAMIENYNRAFGEAKTQNEARYQQQLGIADATTGQRMADVRSAFGRQGADIQQRLTGLGMANTTVAPTMQMGVAREREAALNRTADEMQQTKLGIIGAREDRYPDLGSLQSTMAGAASGTVTPQVAAMLKAFGNIRSV